MAAASNWKGVARFYKTVGIEPTVSSPSASAPLTYSILIDGRRLRTNAMNDLSIPSQSLATAIACEFASVERRVLPLSTPLFTLTCTAIDSYAVENREEEDLREAEARAYRIAAFDEALIRRGRGMDAAETDAFIASAMATPTQAASSPSHADNMSGRHASGAMTSASISGSNKLRDLCLDHLETDSVCYRVSTDADMADPTERLLRKRQDKHYGPLLKWWEDSFGSTLGVAEGFGDMVHPEEAFMVAEDIVDTADPFLKAVLAQVIGATKSTVIAMALVHRAIDVETAFAASRVDEEFQISENGFVEDGHDTARAQVQVALNAASTLLWMLPSSCTTPVPVPGRKDYASLLATQNEARKTRVLARRQKEAELVAAARAKLRQQFIAELKASAVAKALK
jgi:chaperone required for assembly of F1-ATPase